VSSNRAHGFFTILTYRPPGLIGYDRGNPPNPASPVSRTTVTGQIRRKEPAMSHTTETIPLPATSPGAERFLTVHRWGKPGGGNGTKAYIQAALHADEWPGVMAAHHLTRLLDEAARDGRIAGEIVLLPYANPVGMSQSLNGHLMGRFRFADGGGNFNRGWPDLTDRVVEQVTGRLGDDTAQNIALMRDALRQSVSELPDETEKEAHQKALLSLSVDADYVLDLHCDSIALMHLFANAEHEDI